MKERMKQLIEKLARYFSQPEPLPTLAFVQVGIAIGNSYSGFRSGR